MGKRSVVQGTEAKGKRRRNTYRVHGVDSKTGERRLLAFDRLIVEVRRGVEIEIDLTPPSAFDGQLCMFCPPRAVMKQQYEAGTADSFAVFFGAENVLHVKVERRKRSASAMKRPPGEGESRRRSERAIARR